MASRLVFRIEETLRTDFPNSHTELHHGRSCYLSCSRKLPANCDAAPPAAGLGATLPQTWSGVCHHQEAPNIRKSLLLLWAAEPWNLHQHDGCPPLTSPRLGTRTGPCVNPVQEALNSSLTTLASRNSRRPEVNLESCKCAVRTSVTPERCFKEV